MELPLSTSDGRRRSTNWTGQRVRLTSRLCGVVATRERYCLSQIFASNAETRERGLLAKSIFFICGIELTFNHQGLDWTHRYALVYRRSGGMGMGFHSEHSSCKRITLVTGGFQPHAVGLGAPICPGLPEEWRSANGIHSENSSC